MPWDVVSSHILKNTALPRAKEYVFSFAWAELYMTLAAIVRQFDFKLDETAFRNVEPASDQFIIGTEEQSGVHVTPVLR